MIILYYNLSNPTKDNKLSLLSRGDDDEYGFNSGPPARARSPYQSRPPIDDPPYI